jgi:hypothetical protein
MCRMSWKSGSLALLEPSGSHRACYGTALTIFTMTNKCTIISQIITLLHVSTLSCHPHEAWIMSSKFSRSRFHSDKPSCKTPIISTADGCSVPAHATALKLFRLSPSYVCLQPKVPVANWLTKRNSSQRSLARVWTCNASNIIRTLWRLLLAAIWFVRGCWLSSSFSGQTLNNAWGGPRSS